MDQGSVVDALNRILPRVARSLALYAADARPWLSPGDDRLRAALIALASDQRSYTERLAAMILELGGRPELGRFPTEFTDLHDVSANYLAARLVSQQQADLAAIGRLAGRLPAGSPARQLAEEIRGNLQGHLDILEDLATATPNP